MALDKARDATGTHLRMYIRLSCLECCKGSGERSKANLARAERQVRVRSAGRLAVSSVLMSRRKDVAMAVEAPDDAVGERYSRAEDVGGAGEAPDPASGGDDAA